MSGYLEQHRQYRKLKSQLGGEFTAASTRSKRGQFASSNASRRYTSSAAAGEDEPVSIVRVLSQHPDKKMIKKNGTLSLVACGITTLSMIDDNNDYDNSDNVYVDVRDNTKANEKENASNEMTSHVKKLYLSNNSVMSLNGIDQFPSVINLSIANNEIRYLEQLQSLQYLTQLEKLSLEGNFVASTPFYRCIVLHMCSHLETLDGITVTSHERDHVIQKYSDIENFYQGSRTSELRNAILTHLTNILRCHDELYEILGVLDSTRIGSNNDGTPFAQKSRVEKVLRILIEGNTFRWLQIGCKESFNRTIQLVGKNIHQQLLQNLTQSQRNDLLHHPVGQLYEHWEDIFLTFMNYQKEQQTDILQTSPHTRVVMMKDTSTVMDSIPTSLYECIDLIQFDDSYDESEFDNFYRGINRTTKRSFIANSMHMEKGKVVEKEYEDLLHRIASHKRRDVSTSIMHKGLNIQQTQNQQLSSSVAAAVVVTVERNSLKQQQDVNDDDLNDEKENKKHVETQKNDRMSFSDNDNNKKKSQHPIKEAPFSTTMNQPKTVTSKLDFYSESVVQFLNRSLSDFTLDDLEVLCNDMITDWFTTKTDSVALVKLEEDIELEARLGPTIESNPFHQQLTAEARNMTELKNQIQVTLNALTVRHRDLYMCWSISEALQKQYYKIRALILNCQENVNRKLGVLYSTLAEVNDDVEKGSKWIEMVQPLINEVDEGRQQLTELNTFLNEVEQSRLECLQLKTNEMKKKKELLNSIHEITSNINSMNEQIIKNRNISHDAKLVLLEDRIYSFEKRSFLLIGRAFTRWNNKVKQRLAIAKFSRRMKPRSKKYNKIYFFNAWKKVLYLSYRVKLITMKKGSKLLKNSFLTWKNEISILSKAISFNQNYKLLSQQSFFGILKSLQTQKELEMKENKRYDVIVICYLMIRAFRAWKGYYYHSKLSPIELERYTNEAHLFHRRFLFLSWRRLTRASKQIEALKLTSILSISGTRITNTIFQWWRIQTQVNQFHRWTLYCKGMNILKRQCLRKRRRINNWRHRVKEFLFNTHKNRIKQSIDWLYKYMLKCRRLKGAYLKFTLSKMRKIRLHVWLHMYNSYSKSKEILHAQKVVQVRSKYKLQRKTFNHLLEYYVAPKDFVGIMMNINNTENNNNNNNNSKENDSTMMMMENKTYEDQQYENDDNTTTILSSNNYNHVMMSSSQDTSLLSISTAQDGGSKKLLQMKLYNYILDEDMLGAAARYYRRRACVFGLRYWRKRSRISKRLYIKCNVLKYKSRTNRLRRMWLYLISRWITKLLAQSQKNVDDNILKEVDIKKKDIIGECASLRTNITNTKERIVYLSNKMNDLDEQIENTQNNISDTIASQKLLQEMHDTSINDMERLHEECKTILMMDEAYRNPDYSKIQSHTDEDLSQMIQKENVLKSENSQLMLEMENNYSKALHVQSETQLNLSKLSIETDAISEMTNKQKQELNELDIQIERLSQVKQETERELHEYSSNLTHTINNMSNKVKTDYLIIHNFFLSFFLSFFLLRIFLL